MRRTYAGIGAVIMLLAVALGAFGAHMLKAKIGETAIGTYETGVHYQMIHGIAILLTAFFAGQWGNPGGFAGRAGCFCSASSCSPAACTDWRHSIGPGSGRLRRSAAFLLSPVGCCLRWRLGTGRPDRLGNNEKDG